MTTRCEVHVLGKLTVTFADGREPVTKFRTQKAALLLAYLALHQGKSYSRELLIELLWPEADLASSRLNLNTTLSILRRQLGTQALESDHTTVRLITEGITVDALRFEALVQRGLSTRLPANERHAALSEALDLWEPPLPGIYDDWALEAQERLEALADQAREAREALPTPAAPAPTPAPAAPTETLPVSFSRYFGREREREAVGALLPQARLVTLLGPGGVGKTRLSLEVARASAASFPNRLFVSLAEVPTPALVLPALRRTLTEAPPADDPLAQVVGALQSLSGKTLLLLDNLEHLLPLESEEDDAELSLARMARQLLESCPHLTVLATSRQPLELEAEQLFPLEPLETALGVALFVDRARSARPDFTLHESNQAQIKAICTQLDGLPLAIELAAAWVRALSLTELQKRLETELLWLEGRRRDLNPRQKSLEATLRWSWQLLPESQQRLLAVLSLFPGGWTLEAAEAVGGEPEALDLLLSLIDRSLVVQEQEPTGTRYRLLQTIRQFANERLEESDTAAEAKARYLAYFLAHVAAVQPKLVGREQALWLQRLEREHDNLRAALTLSLGLPGKVGVGQALAGELGKFWRMRGYLTEGREWYRRLLAADEGQAPTRARADALHGAGMLAGVQADFTTAQHYDLQSLAIRRELGDTKGIATSLNNLGNSAFSQCDYPTARTFHEESLALRKELGDIRAAAISLNNLGNVAHQQGDYPSARAFHEESLAIKRQLNDKHGMAYSLVNLGNLLYQSDFAAARSSYQEALGIRRTLQDRFNAVICLQALGTLHYRQKCFEQAVFLWSAAEHLLKEIGALNPPVVEKGHTQHLAETRRVLGEPAFMTLWQAAENLSFDEVVTQALVNPA